MTQKNIGTSVPDNEIILLEDLWHLNNVSTQQIIQFAKSLHNPVDMV